MPDSTTSVVGKRGGDSRTPSGCDEICDDKMTCEKKQTRMFVDEVSRARETLCDCGAYGEVFFRQEST